MASSPGLGGQGLLQQQQHQQQQQLANITQSLSGRNSNSPVGLVNGSSQRVQFNTQQQYHHQLDQDAIVPASDQEDEHDDSTDEDEDYNSYMQEQKQQQQLLQHNQQQYDSGDEGDVDYRHGHAQYHQQQQQQQQQQHGQQQRPHHHQHQQLQQIQQQYQLQQQQNLHAYKTQAMNIQQLLHRDQLQDQDMDSHEEEEFYSQNPQHDPHRQHEMEIEMLQERVRQEELLDDDEEEEEEDDDFDDDEEMEHEDGEEEHDHMEDDMLDDEDDNEESETMSLTEDDIDFNLVYAFHTFVATQEGQASVVRNDSLMLLEDSNVYWWLVRVLKTGVIGYIPAENIETPFERLARLNTYRNVALSAPSPEWGTFDEHIEPLDPAILEQRANNRRSVIFTTQNEFLEASETEWTEEEDEEGDWYEDEFEDEEEEEEEEEEEDLEEDGEHEHDHGATEDEHTDADESWRDDQTLVHEDGPLHAAAEDHEDQERAALQLEAQRVQQEILEDQRRSEVIAATHAAAAAAAVAAAQQAIHSSQEDVDMDDPEDEEVQVTNRYRKPLLDDDLFLANVEPRVISLTPPIARDDSIVSRVQTPPGKARTLRLTEESIKPQPQMQAQQQRLQQQQQQQQTQPSGKQSVSPTTGLRSPSFESEEEEKEKPKSRAHQKNDAKIQALLGNKAPDAATRKAKAEQDQAAAAAAAAAAAVKAEVEAAAPVKKPGKFKSLFGVGKSKDKERKEKERLEKEKQKSQIKTSFSSPSSQSKAAAPSTQSGGGIGMFRTRSNSNGSVGSSTANGLGSSSTTVVSTPTVDKTETPPQLDILTLRVYPGNVDFGASMYKTVVITPATLASEVAHQAVIKFRLAPDGTASTGDFYLTVRGVDGDETVLQATDKPMAIYQSLTAHLTTPLPTNHRLSISSVSSMLSVASTGSNSNGSGSIPSTPNGPLTQQTLRRTGSGRGSEPQQKSIRFLLNKKIRRQSSISVASSSSLPATPTTPTTPVQEDFFWVKVVCQAQDLPHSMLLLEGMTTAMDKSDPKSMGQSVATKVEQWIPMHATSNAGDVIFRTLEKIGIRSGVVDGVPDHILAAKRATVPNGLVIEYQLGLKLNGNTSRKFKQGDEVPLPPQVPLQRCFEEHQLVPVRRSPKADVASMPLHPDHIFFLRKATKSLQAEMRFVQEQLQLQQSQPRKSTPSPLRSTGSDPAMSTQSRPLSGIITPSSPGHHVRTFSAAAALNANRLAQNNSGAGSPPIRVPRRTDSVIMSPSSPIVRGNSFDSSSGRPSPTLSAQNIMASQQTPIAQQLSRTPTPDRHQQRTRSPSINQGSPTALARPLQAPSPAPSNMSSSHADQQEIGSRSSTPDRSSRLDRPQRATSPSLTHGPSPLSMSAVMLQKDIASPATATEEGREEEDEAPSTRSLVSPISRVIMKKNAAQGVDIAMSRGVIRSVRGGQQGSGTYQYVFVPQEIGAEEIDITEIIEDVLGGDSDDEMEEPQQQDQRPISEKDSNEQMMSRRERLAAAVARASQTVAAGKERRKASASGSSITSMMTRDSPSGNRSRKSSMSSSSDRDRLEQLGLSARGGDTLLKLERALVGNEAPATSSSLSERASNNNLNHRASGSNVVLPVSVITGNRNLPSPMSMNMSSPSSSPTLQRRISTDAEIQVASVSSVGVAARNQSPMPTVVMVDGQNRGSPTPSSPHGRSSPASPSSSPSAMAMMISNVNSSIQQGGRSLSPLPRPLRTPSPAVAGGQQQQPVQALPHQLSIQTNVLSGTSGLSSSSSSSSGPLSAGVLDGPPSRNSSLGGRSRSASTSVAEISRPGSHSSTRGPASPGANGHHGQDPWLLKSDYNKGMQDLLTLVRGGRSSSFSLQSHKFSNSSAPPSLRGSNTSTPTTSRANRQLPMSAPSSHQASPAHSHASLYNNLNNHTPSNSNSNLHQRNSTKDTPAHDNNNNKNTLDDINNNTTFINDNNTHSNTTSGEDDADLAAIISTSLASSSFLNSTSTNNNHSNNNWSRIWPRTDKRLWDVREECHPEVFECWQGVDADLDKVEKELDSLLATVKAATF
ncbi:hypothetical protein BGZ83_007473 [Gryganskiella cystojenkinii]|nr:hypothetical protein BGZ83_007473 [Gryganskiella cystojenkinii]